MNPGVLLEDVARAFCASNQLKFVRSVGEGAFKQTFEAVASGTSVAVKLYKPGCSSTRSSRELEAMKRCSHPNIAHLISVDTFRFDNLEFRATVEEFLPGGTLTQKGRITGGLTLEIGVSLIHALAHIAKAGLVHRDLKPDNIMFREDGRTPVIVDFGVVRNLGDSSLTPSWAPRGPGTPFFASPEQLNNEKHQTDWRSDQFSLGVVLGVVALGEHPYSLPGLQPHQVVDRVAARESANPAIIRQLQQNGLPAIACMVAPWPVQRYRTPELLLSAWMNQTVLTSETVQV